jgi:ABC-2 type transport system permease protein
MKALLEAELIKLRTTRTFVALASVAVAISVLLAGLVAALTEPTEESVLIDVFQSDFSSLFIMILAVVGITGEWRHRTITGSLLAAPDRLRFLAAKTVAFAVAGLVLSLLVSATVTAVGVATLEIRGLPTPEAGGLLELYGRNAAVAALLGAFGVGVGALARNQAVAIVSVLVLSFAVEPSLTAVAPEVARFGPTGGLANAIAGIDPEDVGFGDANLLAPGLAVAGMLAWIGAAFAAGGALLRARDVD